MISGAKLRSVLQSSVKLHKISFFVVVFSYFTDSLIRILQFTAPQ